MSRLKLVAFAAGLLLTVALSGVRVEAQVFDSSSMTQDFLRMQNVVITQGIQRDSLRAAINRSSTRTNSSANTPVRRTPGVKTATTFFRPVSPPFVPQQLAAQLGKTPEQRQAYTRGFAEALKFYEDVARQQGVPLNDVARAMTFLFIMSEHAYTGGKPLTDKQAVALREQLQNALERDEHFQSLGDRDKQQMYETMAIMGGFTIMTKMAAEQRGDKEAASEIRQFAKQNLEQILGVSAERLAFTDRGLEIR